MHEQMVLIKKLPCPQVLPSFTMLQAEHESGRNYCWYLLMYGLVVAVLPSPQTILLVLPILTTMVSSSVRDLANIARS